MPTSLLPSLLTSVLHAPASALGLIEGIADGAAGLANFAGGTLADDPGRRRRVAVGGYTTPSSRLSVPLIFTARQSRSTQTGTSGHESGPA